jgi:hypothetical protein
MPATDHNKTVIYKIINYDHPGLVYVGSTTSFKHRKNQHKFRALNPDNCKVHLKLYESIRKFGGWESWRMIQICEYPCDSKRDAEKEEDRYMVELKACLNVNRAYCSEERRKEQMKHGQERRKEKLGPDGIKEYNKLKDNQRSDKKKIYYLETRQDYVKEKITCECGYIVSRGSLNCHKKSTRHKLKLESN